MIVVALIILVILAALAIFQLTLIAGAPLGQFAWGGQYEVLPLRLRVGSAAAICIYVGMALLAASRSGFMNAVSEGTFLDVSLWVVTGYLLLGIFANAMSKSKPERYVMTPLNAVLAAGFLLLALG